MRVNGELQRAHAHITPWGGGIRLADGLLATVTRAPNGTDDQWHQSTFQRDDFGNVRQIIESTRSAPSLTTTVTYDDDASFPSTVTNAAGQTTRLSFDRDWGAPDGIVDPNGMPCSLATTASVASSVASVPTA